MLSSPERNYVAPAPYSLFTLLLMNVDYSEWVVVNNTLVDHTQVSILWYCRVNTSSLSYSSDVSTFAYYTVVQLYSHPLSIVEFTSSLNAELFVQSLALVWPVAESLLDLRTQMFGQLPCERVTPDIVFNKVGLDYAGPLLLKLGRTRKPVIVKAYVCVFVSLSVKAVHLELVSDLTTEAFIACLRRFISRRGKPVVLWSDNGKNFVGARNEIDGLTEFLNSMKTQKSVSEFCSTQNMQWNSYRSTRSSLWWAVGGSCKII